MDPLSNPSAVQSTTPVMTSNVTDGVVDCQFFSTKRISVLLDDNDYLLWCQQDLLNMEFACFEQQDSALASWLLSLVSQAVLPHLIGMDTSAQIWNALANLYGSKTTSRLMFYRRALHSQRKGDLCMKEFLMKIKGYCDNLASCREVISEHEHVTTILNSLSPEYESVITIITASQIPYNVRGVTIMLFDAEAWQQVTICEAPSSTNMVSYQPTYSTVNSASTPTYRSSSIAKVMGMVALLRHEFNVSYVGKLVTLSITTIINLMPPTRMQATGLPHK
ncbi:hypothetical protein J1N35_011390 [Gossypium stocksii]|uniref:Uncharacterized protein n=1 Tax=Gossypium stocksii TaxID=47602 RepID=A0A9D4ABF4_9ROSI|nr:hypothetical protein J1N35_011390 [Gossypium stocksii]